MMYHYVSTECFSYKVINKMLDKTGWNEFRQAILECNTHENLDVFLDIFLTISEKEAIMRRYVLVKELLISQKPHREIAKKLNVSIANVTRGSNLIKLRKSDIENIILKQFLHT